MSETKPENFHHSREWPCPACGVPQHSVVQLQLHYARHTPEEKEAAWAKVPAFFAERNKVYNLSEVPKGYVQLRREDLNGVPFRLE